MQSWPPRGDDAAVQEVARETLVAVTNLTDHFYYINKVFGAAPTNITEGQPGTPREWLVTVERNF
jgi:hypothetical protein